MLLLGACSEPEQSGTSAPAFKRELGPYAVEVVEAIILRTQDDDRDMRLRVTYPNGDGPFPIVVFSSGAFCFPDLYARITDHWASHGYVVFTPNHIDSPTSGAPLPADLSLRLMSSRLTDISFIIDVLADLERKIPDLAGKLDSDHMAIAGHSLGGMIALIKSGLPLTDGVEGKPTFYTDDRFDAAVILSGVGQLDQMADDAFSYLSKPTIATGGTLDEGNVGTGEIFPWEWRMAAYHLSPPGDKYAVVLDQGDHYLGGLICRENRGGAADPEGLAIINGTTTAFLDAYLRSDKDALAFVKDPKLDSATRERITYSTK